MSDGFKDKADLDFSGDAIKLGGVDKKTGKPNPTRVEGYYLGCREVTTPMGPGKLHVLYYNGKNIGVWGKANMNSKLASVKPGEMIRIIFEDIIKVKHGTMYKYRVQVKEGDTIDVSSLSPSLDTESYDDSDSSDYVNSDHSYQTDDEEEASFDDDTAADEADYVPPTPPRKAAAVPDASRQDKVKALLAGRKSSRA